MAGAGIDSETIAQGIGVLVGLAILVAVLNGVLVAGDANEVQYTNEQVILSPDGQGELSRPESVSNFSARQTLGDAVRFTGSSDSQLTGQADVAVSGNWTVTTWAKRAPNTTGTRRVLQLDGWLYISHNESSQLWRVTYYDSASLQVYTITAASPSPSTWTFLSVERNATAMSLARNNTTVASVPIDGSGGGEIADAENWNGTVEETRVINETLTPTQEGEIYATPTAPLEVDEVARIYYDGYDGEESVDVYRTGQDLALQNASFVEGFSGEPLVEDDTLDLEVDDYQRDGGTISTTSDGNLTGAPVVFVSYQGAVPEPFDPGGFIDAISGMIQLIVLGVMLAVLYDALE